DEHVERDLEPELGLYLPGRVDALARLVVLDDPARAEGIDVDPVDLPREPDPVGELEPALELRRCSLRPEQDLEPPWDERQVGFGLVADELLEVAPERLFELRRLELRQLETDASAQRVVEAAAKERDRLLDALRLDALDAE